MCLIKIENNSTVAHEHNAVYVNQINSVSPDFYFTRFMKHGAGKCDKMLWYYQNNKYIGYALLKVSWSVD